MRNVRTWFAFAGTLLLCACGDATEPTPQGVAAAPGNAISDPTAVPCNGLPPHAILIPDAAVSLCTGNGGDGGRRSGTVIFSTPRTRDAVFDFYRTVAGSAGLSDAVVTATSYSAQGSGNRTFMVLVAPVDGKTQVTLNWGVDL